MPNILLLVKNKFLLYTITGEKMKIKDFDIFNSYGFLFNYVAADIKFRLEGELKQYNLTGLQFAILLNVYKRGPFAQKDILFITNGDEASATRIVEKMEKKGLIKREIDKQDKRKKLLFATHEGEQLLERVIPYADKANQDTIQSLTPKEQTTLRNILKKIANFDKE